MRVIVAPTEPPKEVAVPCDGCGAVLGVTLVDAITVIYEPRKTSHVFRCPLCARQMAVDTLLFEEGAA